MSSRTKYKLHSIDTCTASVQTPNNSTDTNALSAGADSPGEKGACSFFSGLHPYQHPLSPFKISRATTAQGQPGFQYGGYTFVIVDAWPAEWAYTDDCYVDYVDGEHFLFDLLHPGVGVAIVIVL